MRTPVQRLRVLIIGGGFGGLEVARALRKSDCEVTLIDRRNHHVFQPLLYQVATAALSPADIASPIRHILRKVRNCRVVLAEATGVDLAAKRVKFERGSAAYDYLVLAAGATHSYFGNEKAARLAPGLKTIEDATAMRRRILLAFEEAEYEGSDEERRADLTFAIVGGGATGVELAGAIKHIAAKSIQRDFRNVDTSTCRVILFQGGDRLLPAFDPKLSDRAKRDLEGMGVEVRLNAKAEIHEDGVMVGGELIPARQTFWAAGVKGRPIAATLGVPLNKAGCVIVNDDLSVPGEPNTFVIGDLASAKSAGNAVPGVAPAAMQMGRYVGKLIAKEIAGKTSPRTPFEYIDKGSLATIGKNKAVAQIKFVKIGGFVAWLLWAVVHIMYLAGFKNRVMVMLNWAWSYLVNANDARLITGDAELDLKSIREDGRNEGVEFESRNPEPQVLP